MSRHKRRDKQNCRDKHRRCDCCCKCRYKHRCCDCEKKDRLKVIKAVFPLHLLPANDSILTVLKNDTEALRYTSPSGGDTDVYNVDEVINLYLPLDDVKDVKDIDHIELDLHIQSEVSQEISIGLYLSQTVDIVEEDTVVRQSQRYLYMGHRYSMIACKWTQVGERWDRPVNLGILSADNFSPDEIDLMSPKLQISILGVTGKIVVDNTIQLHVEYLKRN